MIKLAVFGDPIAHSLSPSIHHYFAEKTGIDIDYRAIHATAEQFEDSLQAFFQAGGLGANLTVPHKQAGLLICESFSTRAKAANAVNTLIRTTSGWHGDNTDGLGLAWDLHRQQIDLTDKHILVLGAGGAAQGIVPSLLEKQPASIAIANRTADKALQLAARFEPHNVSGYGLDKCITLPAIDLIIHASAAGHNNDIFNLPFKFESPKPFCYDLSYGQAAKPFLHWAKQQQYRTSDGLGMLVGQAAEAFYLWTGQSIDDQCRNSTINTLLAPE